MQTLFKLSVLAHFVLLSTSQIAFAENEFDACVRKLCVNTEQGDCWIKAGAQLCTKPGKQCAELEDHAPAKVINKTGKWWHMETGRGTGFVNERFMMVSGDKC